MQQSKWTEERIESIRRWTPKLLSFRCSRSPDFRFTAGLYARLGLVDDAGEIVWRPFSMASATDDPQLEFFAVLVDGGAFSTLLARIEPGDPILVDRLAFGFMTLKQLAPGRDLWLIASGTGLGPFVSILRERDAWRDYERIVVVHSVRHADELAYRDEIEAAAARPAQGDRRARLRYLPVVTRERVPGALPERIPRLLEDGRLEQAAGCAIELEHSRAMVCGNPEMCAELRRMLSARGMRTSRRGVPGQLAFENYW